MNFITFPVSSTNIFPAANGKNGSQLLSEWNLRSREMVGTKSTIKYEIGPSYVHGENDFLVRLLQDDSGYTVDGHTLEIIEGRGVINGHYVQTLSSMTVDLLEANSDLKSQAMPPLRGKLALGFKTFYASEETISGSILVENEHNMYVGIQVVILPEAEVVLPSDSLDDPSLVNMDIKLATFTFTNNNVTNIVNAKADKLAYIDAERIKDVSEQLGSEYVKKIGLNAKKIYSFAGKGQDPSTGLDTWQDVTDSTMIWDAVPQRTTQRPVYNESQFVNVNGRSYLCTVHKVPEGMTDEEGNPEYYASKYHPLPTANYLTNEPGVVDASYTKNIKHIADEVTKFRSTLTGNQIMYLEERVSDDSLPAINPAWNIGDYILVGTDYTASDVSDISRAPSTMYVVIPGIAKTLKSPIEGQQGSETIPSSITGYEIGYLEDDEDPALNPPTFITEDSTIRGQVDKDYFRYRYIYETDEGQSTFKDYYYVVATSGANAWSNYILVTGEIPLATETTVGGFLNVSTDATDYGYVYLDDYGRLRLLDYELLRSGTLAYQLGNNVSISGDNSEVQAYLDEYVNNRIAFPSENMATSNVIDITLELTEASEASTITLYNVDSRFNTAIRVHILGSATKTTTINITNCQKVIVDNNIQGTPIVNVHGCCLYYDPYVMNYVMSCEREDTTSTGFEGLSLWYEKFDDVDPNLVVDSMTVSEINSPTMPDQIDFWQEEGAFANDNYYLAALHSITFDERGIATEVGMLVANNSTDNVDPGTKIVSATFTLPQGSGLTYPNMAMQRQMKVTGTFVSAYYSNVDSMWYVTDNIFSAVTQVVDPYSGDTTISGNIAVHSTTTLMEYNISQTSIPAWEPDSYHLFYGGCV